MADSSTNPVSLDYASAPLPKAKASIRADFMTAPTYARADVRRWFLIVAAVLLLAYLLLENPYWVPGGDSDFYVSIARNLAARGAFTYNGAPVAISPPGWPLVMAAVLKVSPYFLPLKLLTLACMLASLLISYFIALRFVPPRVAAVATGLTGLLLPVYSLTYFLHSEGLYCLASSAALLLAFRVREQRGRRGEQIALVLLCVAMPFVRWAGIFQLLPIVAVLLSDHWQRTGRRRWRLAVLCFLTIVGTWCGTRFYLQHTIDQWKLAHAQDQYLADIDNGDDSSESKGVDIIATGEAKHGPLVEYTQRFLGAGRWFAWLLWYPARFASVSRPADVLVVIIGWLVIGLLAHLVVRRLLRGELLWLALAMYCGALCMNWPNPNARYLVPVAPLIVLGIFLALRTLGEQFPAESFNGWKWLRRAFVYSVLLSNLTMYGVDVLIMRSSNFYTDFEAGQHKDLINIAHYFASLPAAPSAAVTEEEAIAQAFARFSPRNGEIVVNERYENLGRMRFSKAGTRAMSVLMDRDIKPMDAKKSKSLYANDRQQDGSLQFPNSVRREVGRVGGHWMLVQMPSIPWRVWHFRLPRSVQERLSKYKNQPDSGGWKLYFYNRAENTFTPQPAPPIDNWPTRVPGM